MMKIKVRILYSGVVCAFVGAIMAWATLLLAVSAKQEVVIWQMVAGTLLVVLGVYMMFRAMRETETSLEPE
jgi:putative Mn2+ efflux pump MntP